MDERAILMSLYILFLQSIPTHSHSYPYAYLFICIKCNMDVFLSTLSLKWKSPDDYAGSLEILEKAAGTLLRNIVSVTAITALVNGNTRIEPKHLKGALDYIHRKCPMPIISREQSGGTSLPASFFGSAEPMYSAMNPSGGSSDTIQFGMGIARADIPQTMQTLQAVQSVQTGGARPKRDAASSALDKWMTREMNTYLEHHRVTVSKTAKTQLMHLAKNYMACLFHDLSKNTPVSVRKVREMLNKKKYAIFH